MLKRFIFAMFVMFVGVVAPAIPAHSAQIANVEYIHKVIEKKWGVTVPYNSNLSSIYAVATGIPTATNMTGQSTDTTFPNG